MIFNGHTPQTLSEIDSETLTSIQTMYADGMIGNHGLLNQISQLSGIVYNYARGPNTPVITQERLLGLSAEYLFPPLTEQDKKEQANKQLLAFMSQSPGFSLDLFGVSNG